MDLDGGFSRPRKLTLGVIFWVESDIQVENVLEHMPISPYINEQNKTFNKLVSGHQSWRGMPIWCELSRLLATSVTVVPRVSHTNTNTHRHTTSETERGKPQPTSRPAVSYGPLGCAQTCWSFSVSGYTVSVAVFPFWLRFRFGGCGFTLLVAVLPFWLRFAPLPLPGGGPQKKGNKKIQ